MTFVCLSSGESKAGSSPGFHFRHKQEVPVLLRSVGSSLMVTFLAIIVLAAITTNATGQSWNALSSGVDGPVYCLAVYKNQLYVGGRFTTAGGTPASNIARWNGVEWSPLGSGTNGAVYALLVRDGELHAGGSFTSCGGFACNSVARWDSSHWVPLGSGLNGPVFSIAEYQRRLFIGGGFTRVGEKLANWIAQWDGSNWKEVSGGLDNTVYALTVTPYNELIADLYVGGAFIGQDLARIAWYHPAYQTLRGTEWGGFNAPVFALTYTSLGLVAGGAFTANNQGYTVNHLALRGNEYYGGTDGDVYALLWEGGNLTVGGSFSSVGPAPGLFASNIAQWNGTTWEGFGPGTNGSVRTLVVFRGELYAGGEFDSAGTTKAGHVARWGMTTGVGPASGETPLSVALLQSYPNPFNPSTTISFQLPMASMVRLSVHDMLGREVSVLVNERREAGVHDVKFEAAGLASGVYLCRLQAGGFVRAGRLQLVR